MDSKIITCISDIMNWRSLPINVSLFAILFVNNLTEFSKNYFFCLMLPFYLRQNDNWYALWMLLTFSRHWFNKQNFRNILLVMLPKYLLVFIGNRIIFGISCESIWRWWDISYKCTWNTLEWMFGKSFSFERAWHYYFQSTYVLHWRISKQNALNEMHTHHFTINYTKK